MNAENPKVSVIIPVYNGADYLKEAIDSALNQTYKDVEVIVINDGSNDGGATDKIATSYGDKIRYFTKLNGGVASALNLGIKKMEGDYFCWLSHDDIFYPEKTKIQIDFLKTCDENTILYSDFDVADSNLNLLLSAKIKDTAPEKFLYKIMTSSPVHGCTVMISKRCFDEIGLFNEELKTTQDYDMWFKLLKKFKFVHIPQPLIKTRHHSGQGTIMLKPLHSRECNNLYIGFLNKTTDEEISKSSSMPKTMAYALIAGSLVKRKLYKAGNKFFMRFLKNLSYKDVPIIFKIAVLVLKSLAVSVKLVLMSVLPGKNRKF
ncbi:MAG TPA: glycosyltransferase [Elusimicrobiales bacterium]|nr:glycosyltransferase [Elusimicrobiales bacterium]